MKRFYESPSAEIERFTISNVFTSSFGGGIEEGGETVDPWGIQTMNELEY